MRQLIILFIIFFPSLKVQSQVDWKDLEVRDCFVYYKDSLFTGVSESYFRNQAKQAAVNYKNGLINGIVTYWYKNGQISLTAEYKNNERFGFTREYYKNGKIKYEIEYDATGQIVNHTYYTWNKRGEKFMHKGKEIEHKHQLGILSFSGGRTKYIKTKVSNLNQQ
ncbi:MAG: hypothetical protein IPP64_09585 [Bacteroidetes bacterium]|nr:hypothetical protein [Bacteroidota bacterium]